MSGRFAHCETVIAKGQSLIDRGHYASKEIRAKIKQLQHNWMKLKELLITRSDRLKDAAQSLQVNNTTASTYRAFIPVLLIVQFRASASSSKVCCSNFFPSHMLHGNREVKKRR